LLVGAMQAIAFLVAFFPIVVDTATGLQAPPRGGSHVRSSTRTGKKVAVDY
jgi:hypothetical protein